MGVWAGDASIGTPLLVVLLVRDYGRLSLVVAYASMKVSVEEWSSAALGMHERFLERYEEPASRHAK